jgi:hypothetical protein
LVFPAASFPLAFLPITYTRSSGLIVVISCSECSETVKKTEIFCSETSGYHYTTRRYERKDDVIPFNHMSYICIHVHASSSSEYDFISNRDCDKRFRILPLRRCTKYEQIAWPLVRKRTIPTERPLLLGEF